MTRRLIIVLALVVLFVGGFMKPGDAQAASCTGPSIADSGQGMLPGDVTIYAGQTFTFMLKPIPQSPGAHVTSVTMNASFIGQPVTLTGIDSASFTAVAPSNGVWHIINGSVHTSAGVSVLTWSYSAACPGKTTSPFLDGRLNKYDTQQTAAIYCDNGGVTVYVPGTPKWYKAFHATMDDINAVPKHPARNTLIKQGKGARLYRLTSGKLQVNSPELDPTKGDYLFVFSDCS